MGIGSHFAYDLESEDKDLTFDERDSAAFMPKCPRHRSGRHRLGHDDRPPLIRWADTIVYETHVKGFTQLNPAIPKELRGTFEGLGHKAVVDYIKSLGITSVELMPIHAFPGRQPSAGQGPEELLGL